MRAKINVGVWVAYVTKQINDAANLAREDFGRVRQRNKRLQLVQFLLMPVDPSVSPWLVLGINRRRSGCRLRMGDGQRQGEG